MKNLFNERKDIYNDLADLKINTKNDIQKTITEILNKLPIWLLKKKSIKKNILLNL